MDTHSDNFRQRYILVVMKCIKSNRAKVIIYEPILEDDDRLCGRDVVNDLAKIQERIHSIVVNRYDGSLGNVKEKIYTRDTLQRD